MGFFEAGIQTNILNYLKAKGAYPVNIHGDEHQKKGVPDILVCYKGKFIAFECKQADGNLSKIQRVHLRQIQKAGGIGEAVRSLKRVIEIIECVEADRTWNNSVY
jgi:penicillin-binding protein-related factor A (putative recombinase)